ncbi:hypothetical protein SCD_n01331 [Sulfuricella denitrificans skB26]|uniref:Uncharacterized protein n=1 Tax=Sulfuricella denitrificans (strain DSM 22764 / NBRC 105220 / skB26) TaxID=1163617 RepID=S6AC02_SULDS|nr:hypothetical protein SCD_n01331 [Sulfuricella denitrificans skB26]
MESPSAVNGNNADLVGEPGKIRFKAIDVGVIQYLKLVHTELYEKLIAAVRSIKK